MSPYEPMPHLVGTSCSHNNTDSYRFQHNPDPDSSDAGFASDSDGASFISETSDSPDSKHVNEDPVYRSERQRDDAIDAHAAQLRETYGHSTHQAPDRCGTTGDRIHFRHVNIERLPVPSVTNHTKERRGSPPSEQSAHSKHDRLRDQYYQRYSRGSAERRPSGKPTRRVTMPETTAHSRFSRETESTSDVEGSDRGPFTRSTVIMPWGPHIDLSRDVQRITEHGLGITTNQGSETEGASCRHSIDTEMLGCEYTVW